MRLKTSAAFTLVEMLIIAPIMILIITGFIAVMINMTGSVLVSQESTAATYNTNTALDQIEKDIQNALQFPTSTAAVASPEGPNDSAGIWSSGASGPLVLSTLATTLSQTYNGSTPNSLVYLNNQPNACSSGNAAYNTPYQIYIVYFIKNNQLWRRTILPDVMNGSTNLGQPISTGNGQNVCGQPWQRNSCSTGNGGNCVVKDDLLLNNAQSMTLTFYKNAGDTTPAVNQVNAAAAGVSLTTQTSAAGETYTYTGTIRAKRANVSSTS